VFAAAAYGSTPLPQGQVVAGADPNAPKAVDYSSYYSQYGKPFTLSELKH